MPPKTAQRPNRHVTIHFQDRGVRRGGGGGAASLFLRVKKALSDTVFVLAQ